MFLSSAPSALLTLLHPYANTTIFTVLSWFRLNYAEVASLSLRICVKTIVFLYVSSRISSCNSRTPAGREQSLERSCSAADGKYMPPACTRGGPVMVGCVSGCVCACVKEGCREPRTRCRGEAGWQLACGTTQSGFDRRSNLGGCQKKFSFELGANNCPWLHESSCAWYTLYKSVKKGDCIEEIAKFIFSFFS